MPPGVRTAAGQLQRPDPVCFLRAQAAFDPDKTALAVVCEPTKQLVVLGNQEGQLLSAVDVHPRVAVGVGPDHRTLGVEEVGHGRAQGSLDQLAEQAHQSARNVERGGKEEERLDLESMSEQTSDLIERSTGDEAFA